MCKWIWAFGNAEKTVLVMGTCMKGDAAAELPALKRAILTARWGEAPRDPLEGLGFRLRDTAGMKMWRRIGNNIMFTPDGKPDPERTGKPLFLAGRSVADAPAGDRRAAAGARLRAWVRGAAVKIESQEPSRSTGCPDTRPSAPTAPGRPAAWRNW